MRIECRRNPCHSSCPNAPDPKYPKCEFCGADIDEIHVQDRKDHCSECWKDWLLKNYTQEDLKSFALADESAFYDFITGR